MSLGGLFASNETNSTTEIINKTVNDMTTRISNQNTSVTDSRTGTVQELDVGIEIGENVSCPIEINQSSIVTSKVYKNFFAENKQDIEKDLSNAIETTMKDKIEQETQAFGLGSNEANIHKSNINNTINDLSTRIVNSLDASFNAALEANQKGKVWLKIGKNYCEEGDKGINIAQNVDLTSIVEEALSSKNVTEEIAKLDNLIATTAETDVSQIVGGCCGGLVGILIIAGLLAGLSKKRTGSWIPFKKGNPFKKIKSEFGRKQNKLKNTIKKWFKL